MLPDHWTCRRMAPSNGMVSIRGKEPCSSALHGTVASADAACMANTRGRGKGGPHTGPGSEDGSLSGE